MTAREEPVPVRLPKAAELVAANLRRRIIVGEIDAGAPLASETELLEQFDVSRPTLREAFRILEAEGLISVRRGARGGARVHPPRVDLAGQQMGFLLQFRGTKLADVYECRTEVEAQLARRAALHATESGIDRLEREYAEGETLLDDPDEYFKHDHRFHALLAEIAGNKTMEVLVTMLFDVVAVADIAYIRAHGITPEQSRAAHAAHARLLSHLRAGDAARAERYWRDHLEEMGRQLLAVPDATTVVELLS